MRRVGRQSAENEGSPRPTVASAAAEPLEEKRVGQVGQEAEQQDPQGASEGGEHPQGQTGEVAQQGGEGQGEGRRDPGGCTQG